MHSLFVSNLNNWTCPNCPHNNSHLKARARFHSTNGEEESSSRSSSDQRSRRPQRASRSAATETEKEKEEPLRLSRIRKSRNTRQSRNRRNAVDRRCWCENRTEEELRGKYTPVGKKCMAMKDIAFGAASD